MKPVLNYRIQLLLIVIDWCLLNGVVGTLTDKPENAVGLIDEQLQLQCASDTTPNNIQWLYEALVVSNAPCVAADPRYTMAYNTGTQCYLNVQGNATTRLSGPYACRDESTGARKAQAIVIIIDPKPTCAVTTTGQIVQGQNVTLSCKMDYYYKAPRAALRPGAVVTASISWETAAGTFITDSSIDLTYMGDRVGQSLQTDVWMTVTGTEIPSYKCTTSFQFSATDDTDYTYAVNSLTYTSTSDVTPVWLVTDSTSPESSTSTTASPPIVTDSTSPESSTSTTASPPTSIQQPDLTLILGLSLGIGIPVVVLIVIILLCICCPCCPLYRICRRPSPKTGGQRTAHHPPCDVNQPQETVTSYEGLKPNTQGQPHQYKELSTYLEPQNYVTNTARDTGHYERVD